MKLFQLYPKALAHLTCKSPANREFSTKTRKERKGLGTSPFGLWPHYRAHPLRF